MQPHKNCNIFYKYLNGNNFSTIKNNMIRFCGEPMRFYVYGFSKWCGVMVVKWNHTTSTRFYEKITPSFFFFGFGFKIFPGFGQFLLTPI